MDGRLNANTVRTVAFRILMLFVGLVTLYVFWPSLASVFGSFDDLGRIRWWWFVVMVLAQAASFVCVWSLQRMALGKPSWFAVGASQLASNALSRVVPGGAAAAGALQYRMLTLSGVTGTGAASALAATGILLTAVVAALPLLAVPMILLGRPVPTGLAQAAWIGAVVFLVLGAIGFALARTDRPLVWLGDLIDRVRRRDRDADSEPLAGRLVEQRNVVVRILGKKWQHSVVTSVGKWLFDYLSLLAALTAVGADPDPTLVMLAYAAAAVLGMIPITPGGIGFVEAGLTATLALAGVPGGDATVAVLAYRLVSYWLPLPVGLGAYVLFRVRQSLTPPR